jgi:hypothetical protein
VILIHPKYVKRNDHVDIWDMGPAQPIAPVVPVRPVEGKDLKGPDLKLAEIHYEDALEDYKLALRAWGAQKVEYQAWRRTNGGPLKIELWSTDALHAINIDPERYRLELPKGAKPGPAQLERDRIAEMSERELQEAREKDPQFGRGSQR